MICLYNIAIQAHRIVTSADWLGSQAVGPWTEGTSSIHCCHECHWETNHGGQLDRPTTLGRPRTLIELQTALLLIRDLKGQYGTVGLIRKMMQDMGINKLHYALDPKFIPYADPIFDLPGDIMHIFLCGFTRKELAWLIDIFVKAKYFTLEQLNVRLKSLRLPKGKRIPALKAASTNKTRREMSLDLSASETMYFALFSVILFDGLNLPPAALNLPCWQCWLKHRDFLVFCLQHEFKRTDADVMDKKASAFLNAFEEVSKDYNT